MEEYEKALRQIEDKATPTVAPKSYYQPLPADKSPTNDIYPPISHSGKYYFLVTFFVLAVIAILVILGIFVNQISQDKFKSTITHEVALEPIINMTSNNDYQIPINNNFTIVINNYNYINVTGNHT